MPFSSFSLTARNVFCWHTTPNVSEHFSVGLWTFSHIKLRPHTHTYPQSARDKWRSIYSICYASVHFFISIFLMVRKFVLPLLCWLWGHSGKNIVSKPAPHSLLTIGTSGKNKMKIHFLHSLSHTSSADKTQQNYRLS